LIQANNNLDDDADVIDTASPHESVIYVRMVE